MKRVAIIGGSFDPIHLGHIEMGKLAKKELGVDEVWYIPTHQTPLKDRELTEDEHRKKMVEIAIQDEATFKLNPIELDRKKKSYTYHTLKKLLKDEPDTEFYVLIGSDQMAQFQDWKNADKLVSMAHFICVDRDGSFGRNDYDLECMPMKQIPVSSSMIREGNGLNYVDPRVLEYIYANRLYIQDFVKSRVRHHRFLHSLSVAKLCEKFAQGNGLDPQKAYLAGLFHDVCKSMLPDQMRPWVEAIAPQYVNASTSIWHGFVGGEVIDRVFGIKDRQIKNAIRWHVLGLSDEPYAKIVYCADKLDPLRGYDSSALIKACEKDIDHGFDLTKDQNDKYIQQKRKEGTK
ncbi:nicotinate-nucleotide adenylyltransferase [Dubosiella newyorkensis]|jgi:nicotinate-nucleotide adenylyltransferase|uniref:nicotinate-nucleotide adenylyltransferase n=2 Tax=Dubosiella newyorkensis TaxID=1862672 RepID=UPI00235464DB|nr:nicotinate-nucleotide adenylyltransferase [Dubosiella newyorkensis]MCI9040391.1 nicotinate (nicotinamide) nucleotide adenylyltransferase [Dubosiella newyorkensis]